MDDFERDASSGYFPLPSVVLAALQTLVEPATAAGATILDNCAGDGATVACLAEAWNLTAYAVEVHPERARDCAARLGGRTLTASAERISLSPPPSVWFFNPPFDDQDESGRFEIRLLEASLKYALAPLTLAVLVLPERSLSNPLITDTLSAVMTDVRIRRFPHTAEEYGQVVLFGLGRAPGPPVALPPPGNLLENEFHYSIARRPAALKFFGPL